MDPRAHVVDELAQAVARLAVPKGGEPLIVACSGGPDSTALLLGLATLGRWPLHAVYVDHQLRPGTTEEAALVAANARALGATAEAVTVDVPRRGNRLAAARSCRYAALVEVARRRGSPWVVVGHTLSDQAETVLFRIERGDPPLARAGMPARRSLAPGIDLLRPLLAVSRGETLAAVLAAGLPTVDDPGNHQRERSRVRLRQRLASDGSERRYAALAEATQGELAAARLRSEGLGDLAALTVATVAELDEAALLCLFRRAGAVSAGLRQVRALLHLLRHRRGSARLDLGDGVVAERSYDRLRLGPPPPPPQAIAIAVAGPGAYRFLDRRITVSLVDAVAPGAVSLCAHPFPWTLRNPRPGDRLRRRGGSRKLQDVLVDHKVPRGERWQLPLLVDGAGELVWLPLPVALEGPEGHQVGPLVVVAAAPRGASVDAVGRHAIIPR